MQKIKKRKLTDKQIAIIKLIACGYQDKEIAEEFNMSLNGIRSIVNRVLDRMAVVNRAHLVYEAVKEGIIE